MGISFNWSWSHVRLPLCGEDDNDINYTSRVMSSREDESLLNSVIKNGIM